MSDFVHLHLHSQFSLLDGANRLDDVIKAAGEAGMPAVALTDHGNMFGAIEVYNKARAAGIKPIIGMEAYVAQGSRLDRTPGRRGAATTWSSSPRTRPATATCSSSPPRPSSRGSTTSRGSTRSCCASTARG